MLITKKMLLALTLVGALVGAGVGSLITRSAANSTAATTNSDNTQAAARTPEQVAATNSGEFRTTLEQTAYLKGFDEGLANCTTAANSQPAYRTSQPAYRTSTYRAPAARRSSNTRRVYYDYASQPKGRSFWQKHRDKLTLAIGTGAGAGVGALVGGKKGAGIGSLVGLGSSALYTYKLRKKSPQRY